MPIATPDTYVGRPGRPIYIGKIDPTLDNVEVGLLTIKNETGTLQEANFISPMFGMQFEEGLLPSGTVPVLRTAADTDCPLTIYKVSRWPDGSMRSCGAFARIPIQINAGATVSFSVKRSSSTPAASNISPATIAANADLKVELSAVRNWSGSWTSALNQAISELDYEVWGTGPAGVLFRAYQEFRQGGTDHAQAGVWHYVLGLQNAAGGLYGVRHLGKFANGWHDVTSPAIQILTAENVSLLNGATQIRAINPSMTSKPFVRVTGLRTDTGYSLGTGMAATFTTTGVLPSGLATGTTYYVRIVFGGFITIHTTSGDAASGANPVALNSAGTGTHTMVPVGADPRTVAWMTPLFGDTSDWELGAAVKVASTGTPPAGLIQGTSYFVGLRLQSANGYLTLHNGGGEGQYNENPVGMTDNGTGTLNLVPVVRIDCYACGPFTVGATGQYDFIQAGGSGQETACTVQFDKTKTVRSKVLGPVNLSASGFSLPVRAYATDRLYDLTWFEDTTGERPDMGPVTGWCMSEFLNSQGLQTIRVHGLQFADKCWQLRRKSTKKILNSTTASITGLGASVAPYRFRPSNYNVNLNANAPSDISTQHGRFDWAHKPGIYGYAWLRTGEPHWVDMLYDQAFAGSVNTGQANVTVGGTQFNNIFLNDGQSRVAAWILRDVAHAVMFGGADDPEVVELKQILADNFDWVKAAKLAGTAFARSAKVWPTDRNNPAPWMQNYLITSVCSAYTATQDPDALTTLTELIQEFDVLRQTFGLYSVATYYYQWDVNPISATSFDTCSIDGVVSVGSWDAATDRVGITISNPDWGALANGGKVRWGSGAPGGLSNNTTYHFVEVSGGTVKLAATPGGPALDITSNGSGGSFITGLSGSMAANTLPPDYGSKQYTVTLTSACRWARALGVDPAPTMTTAIENWFSQGTVNWANDPAYAFKDSFTG